MAATLTMFDRYKQDPDYLGALTMFDSQLGRMMQLLKDNQVYENTIIFYTADNGPANHTLYNRSSPFFKWRIAYIECVIYM